jgi:hypothetical protein
VIRVLMLMFLVDLAVLAPFGAKGATRRGERDHIHLVSGRSFNLLTVPIGG